MVSLSNLNVSSNLVGNYAYWTNSSLFQGPLLPAVDSFVVTGNALNRFQLASLQQRDLSDPGFPIRAGGSGSSNVYLLSDSTAANSSVSITMDQAGTSMPFGPGLAVLFSFG